MKKWLKRFLMSFYHAGNGVMIGFRQRNMKIHVVAAIIVILVGFVFQLSKWEWLIVIMLIGTVWLTELINTSVEELANLIRDNNKLDFQATKSARDLAAGAVLIAATIALIVGVVIIGSKIIN